MTTPIGINLYSGSARFLLAVLLLMCGSANAQRPDANYDESKVGKYSLPDPLVLQNGERVRAAATWSRRRRAEILQLFETNMFGRSPGRPKDMKLRAI